MLAVTVNDRKQQMKPFRFIFLLILLFQNGCHTGRKQTVKEIDDLKPFPVVLEEFSIDKYIRSFDEENPTWLTSSNYRFYYIGEVKDTVYLTPFIYFPSIYPPLPSTIKTTKQETIPKRVNPYNKYYIEWDKESNLKNWTQVKIDIQIDTVTKISSLFPVMLTNRDTDTIIIGYGSQIPLIMEATDTLGNWKPIQERYIYLCGNDVGSIMLPPNESVLTLAPIFKGNYKTKLRFTLGDNHSKPFNGFINIRQFQSKFDKQGNYIEAYKSEIDESKTTKSQ
jgi:hypothetical protein